MLGLKVYNVMKVLFDREFDVDVVKEVVSGNRDFGALLDEVEVATIKSNDNMTNNVEEFEG